MSGWRVFFVAAAVFNLAAGLPLMLMPEALLGSFGLPVPADLLYHRITGALIANFAGLYAFVAYDLERYRPTVWLGVVGKAAAVALAAQAYFQGAIPFSVFSVAFGDVAFIIGFLAFLARRA